MLIIDETSNGNLLGLLMITRNDGGAAPTTPTIPKSSTLTGNDATTARSTIGQLEMMQTSRRDKSSFKQSTMRASSHLCDETLTFPKTRKRSTLSSFDVTAIR